MAVLCGFRSHKEERWKAFLCFPKKEIYMEYVRNPPIKRTGYFFVINIFIFLLNVLVVVNFWGGACVGFYIERVGVVL